MARKDAATYSAVFQALIGKAAAAAQQFNPSTVLSDFESGLVSSVAANFPNALHRNCHFHFCQAIYRKVQAYGLCGIYDSEPQVRLQVRQLMALAFLPVAIVRLTYRTLQLQADGRLHPLFVYFEQQWLTAVRPLMWNVYGENLRTNNDCEGWHVRFNNAIRRHHPNIWQFMDCMREEQAAMEVLQQQIMTGRQARRSNKKYLTLQRRITRLQTRYDRGSITAIDFITGVSYNLSARH